MIPSPISKIVLVATIPALLAGCSEAVPLAPDAQEVRFSSASAGKGPQAGLPGHIFGGLNSSRSDLELLIRYEVEAAELFAGGHPEGHVTGAIVWSDPLPAIRNAREFREWLVSSIGASLMLLEPDYVYITYDDDCVPTQVRV